ncbi:MAG: 2Fe-2S iron-sulfur cluster binding domain-containing protein [Rhodobacter sp.]|nr:2Fe-2S iron-sulfur cluster binding domain-containing protein [Paracoccaceae bacterium]MCC0075129.1 2Fe-2S iron-sulfur cluster binding domain-containing protein [Rhodobacter sp.]
MKATWILPDGSERSADVPAGRNLMEAAVAANIPGVIGECGGTLSCATCHVYVDDAWRAKVGGPGDFEEAMLDVTEAERTEASRLSCQIEMTEALDGIVLRVPEA